MAADRPPVTDSGGHPADDRLDSWKEIAAHLNRDVRTVYRWEKQEGLPVHRHLHAKRGTVYAYKHELDTWLRVNRNGLETREAHRARSRRQRLRLAASLAIVAVVAGGLLLWRWATAPPHPRITSLAVLPFENLSGDPEQDYLSDGLTEEMIAQLGRLNPQQLRVIARTSAMQYKDSDKGIAEIGQELGVDFVVEGSVRQQGEHLRITATLIQVSDQTQLWSEVYDREVGDILKLQGEVAQAVAREIRLELPVEAKARLDAARTVNPEAYQAYLKGRHYSNFGRPWATRKAIEHFEQAVEIDPNFGLAYAALGRTGSYRREYNHKARAAALRALELDPTLGEAHTALGMFHTYSLWDWAGAEKSFRRGIELDPANAIAHHEYARYLTAMGRFDEAIAECKLALELDPVSRLIATELGRIFHHAHRNDEAIQWYQKAVEIDPNSHYPHLFMGFAYEQKGMYDKAHEKFRRAAELAGEPSFASTLARGYDAGGYRGSRMAALRWQLTPPREGKGGPIALAMNYAALGNTNEAVDTLEQAFAERDGGLAFLRVNPALDPIRDNPRFRDLVRRMNFPE